MTHFGKTSIHNALNHLEAKNILTRVSGGWTKGGRSLANSYILNLTSTIVQNTDDHSSESELPVFKNEATIVQNTNYHSSESEHQPKYNQNLIQNPIQKEPYGGMDGGDECFEEFWKNYPDRFFPAAGNATCKTPAQKKAALIEYKKILSSLKDESAILKMKADIISGIKKWAVSDKWKYDDPKYISQPSMWLMNGRWNEEPPHFDLPDSVIEAQQKKILHEKDLRKAQDHYYWRLCYRECENYDRDSWKCLAGRQIPPTLMEIPSGPDRCTAFQEASVHKNYPGPYPDIYTRLLNR